jgi:hypothetical protein
MVRCKYNLLARKNTPTVQAVELITVQNRGQGNLNRFNQGNRSDRAFHRNGRLLFQNNHFRQEGANQCQEAGRPCHKVIGDGTEEGRARTNFASVVVSLVTSRWTVHTPLPAKRLIKGKHRRAKACR